MKSKLRFIEVKGDGVHETFCAAVDTGLSQTPKSLPTRYLYDVRGSELFEQITELPEYYLTRCETDIFERHASEIVATMPLGTDLIEFGSGSSKKTRYLIESFLARQGHLEYAPIDISTEFLRATAEGLLEDYPNLSISAVSGEYFDAARQLPDFGRPRLVLFLGSNIGNLTRDEAVDFMQRIRSQFKPGDRLLVGIDLLKDPAVIHAAYNDSQGITGEFNKNLLVRINRELDASFDLARWRHSAPYLAAEDRIEMRLYSVGDQEVSVDAVGRSFVFRDEEFIHTEWSHKYSLESFGELAAMAGLEVETAWEDEKHWFASFLLRPISERNP